MLTQTRPIEGAWRPALQRVLTGKKDRAYATLYDIGHLDRIGIVKAGLPAKLLTTLAQDMQVSRERLYGWLGIARATANRKVQASELLNQDESERALGIVRLVGQVEKVVAESGDPVGFNAALWTAQWLQQPNKALGGKEPGGFMDTSDGRALVTGLIAQMQAGTYA
jgi:putative toxin-antitoxin system antitoxin component (TIGR02293 family)